MARYCASCGKQQDETGKFCPGCGASLTGSPPAANPLAGPITSHRPQNNMMVVGIAIGLAILALLAWLALRPASTDARKIAGEAGDAAAAAAPAKRDWSNYADEYLSAEVAMLTTGKANSRSYPSPNDTIVSTTYPKGATLKGRWVKGTTAGTKWLKLADSGSYVWEGNLAEPSAVAAAQGINFADYRGKYPMDRVGSTSFVENPKVHAMALAAVGNRRIISQIETRLGPMSPIVISGSQLLAWGCEAHNCSDFNWSYVVMQGKSGQSMRVCYHDWSTMNDNSDWYEGGRFKASKPGGCPSELNATGQPVF